jgi:hypothetical protein
MLTNHKASLEMYNYQGRTEILSDSSIALISSASSVSINFSGSQCEIYLKGQFDPYNYVSYELDGEYLGRFKIQSDSVESYKVVVPTTNKPHQLKIVKDSEVRNGAILFYGVEVDEILPPKPNSEKYIEFIGNSITCGAAAGNNVMPCEVGEYFDQQNAYMSYGSEVARALNIDFMLSSVSGIGIYRNWNDENIDEPIMPQVYENLYLNTDIAKPYNFSRQPDIVSVCLGTNDLSHGDGIKSRLPFNKEKFISNYISFLKTVYQHYPETQIVLLNSPMIEGETNTLLMSCLTEIQKHFESREKSILLFQFSKAFNNGCSGHPSVEEHKQIAQELTPFLKKLLIK